MPTIAISRGRYNGSARPGEEQPKLLGWREVSQTALILGPKSLLISSWSTAGNPEYE